MRSIEANLLQKIEKHIDVVAVICFTVLGFIVRASGRNWISSDMKFFLIPWYDQISQNGGLKGLGQQVGNYNAAYQTIIALLTYLPFGNVYGYKIVSCVFDYMLAVCGAVIVKMCGPKEKWYSVLVYGAILLHPSSFFNSGYWGQCDSIYGFFCIVALICLIKNKNKTAIFLLGIALSFKLQAIFILPFVLFLYFYKKDFSIVAFLCMPLGFFATAVPALICGKPFTDLFNVYVDQTYTNNNLYLNWPSIWRLLTTDNEYGYWELKPMAIALTVGVLLFFYYYAIKRKVTLDAVNILFIALITVYTCAMFLPAMHERYNYITLMLAIMISFIELKTIPLCIVLSLIEIGLYGMLFKNIPNLGVMVVFNCAVYFAYIIYFIRYKVVKK